MRRNYWLGLLILLAIVVGAGYISWPTVNKIGNRDVKLRQGLDLKGGVSLVYELDLSSTPTPDQPSAINSVREVIENRVNSTGVSEPVIQTGKVGNNSTIRVELPGLTDTKEAIDLIGKTAQLDFRTLANADETDPNAQANWAPTGLTGKQLERANVTFDPTTNKPQVSLQFNTEGTKLFSDITSQNIGQPVAIFLDEEIISNPTVQNEISNGQAVITGNFTVQEVKDLVNLLNAGALAVPIHLTEQRQVGATLGEESIKASLTAGLFGLGLVVTFMLVNYQLCGLAATLALIGYALVTFALFKLFHFTLTLSGLAGFILSIGMAVDANILIFERLREELKEGSQAKIALEHSFARAWPSVRDSNTATLLTCAVLYFSTTGGIRGFALTLALGVFVSLFSSISLSRAILRLFTKIKFLERGLARV